MLCNSSHNTTQAIKNVVKKATNRNVHQQCLTHCTHNRHQRHYHNTPTTTNDIRQSFLDYYNKQHNHVILPSSSVIPLNDPSILFINSGMAPLKNIFIGKTQTQHKRATTCQLCIRAGGKHNDLDNVGYTDRHHTLFEMLGNFSFFDYYKQYACESAWDYITNYLDIDKGRLIITVHSNDSETGVIWSKMTGWSTGSHHIRYINSSDNIWSMGNVGPCGYCTEIYVQLDKNNPDSLLEVWNIVFMSQNQLIDGTTEPLDKPCIDTGMGLERITSIIQNKTNNFDIDIFVPIFSGIRELHSQQANTNSTLFSVNSSDLHRLMHHKNISIGQDKTITGICMRVIADHIRAITFLIADNITPSNTQHGYVLRRIIRRAITYGSKLGFDQPFLHKLVPYVIQSLGSTYTYLSDKQQHIQDTLHIEEQNFYNTLSRGMKVFFDRLNNIQQNNITTFKGSDAFLLYDTYGFPLDVTQLLAREHSITVDENEYEHYMNEQRNRGRQDRLKHNYNDNTTIDIPDTVRQLWSTQNITNEFIGYQQLSVDNAKILSIHSIDNNNAYIVLDKNPFYATSGGQVNDTGIITAQHNNVYNVINCTKLNDNCTVLHVTNNNTNTSVTDGLQVGSTVSATVNNTTRQQTAIHHTATHLLHSALRHTLSDNNKINIQQAGSLVNNDKLRFDYTYNKQLTNEQIEQIEQYVNNIIQQHIPINVQHMSLQQAKQQGAIALFSEKYNIDSVRVISAGSHSIELCGGTHVNNTSQIYPFKIISDISIASGVRRIDAVAGPKAYNLLNQSYDIVKHLSTTLKIPGNRLLDKVTSLQKQINDLKQQLIQQQTNTNTSSNATIQSSYKDMPVHITVLPDHIQVDNPMLRAITTDITKSQPDIVHVYIHNSSGSISIGYESKTNNNITAKQLWYELGRKLSNQYIIKGGGNNKLVLGKIEPLLDHNKQSNLLSDNIVDIVKSL